MPPCLLSVTPQQDITRYATKHVVQHSNPWRWMVCAGCGRRKQQSEAGSRRDRCSIGLKETSPASSAPHFRCRSHADLGLADDRPCIKVGPKREHL